MHISVLCPDTELISKNTGNSGRFSKKITAFTGRSKMQEIYRTRYMDYNNTTMNRRKQHENSTNHK